MRSGPCATASLIYQAAANPEDGICSSGKLSPWSLLRALSLRLFLLKVENEGEGGRGESGKFLSGPTVRHSSVRTVGRRIRVRVGAPDSRSRSEHFAIADIDFGFIRAAATCCIEMGMEVFQEGFWAISWVFVLEMQKFIFHKNYMPQK